MITALIAAALVHPVQDPAPVELFRAFKKGDQTIFTIFTGPLKDQAGAEKVAAGTAMKDEELLGMTWFVEGVNGELPKS